MKKLNLLLCVVLTTALVLTAVPNRSHESPNSSPGN
jgi:hypothetical protein